jgi:endonuclease YncB( thermonuclease family)
MTLANHLVLKGEFALVGSEPDGDSVHFVADDPSLFAGLRNGHRVRLTKAGAVQLRFEGVDAAELHYGRDAQPLGASARDALLKHMGFGKVQFKAGTTSVQGATPDSLPGAILSKAVEINGRPVSFVYVGEAAQAFSDADNVLLTPELLRQSLNWWLLEDGLAYYTVYTSTPLRNELRAAAETARGEGGRGNVWTLDSSSCFKLIDQTSIGPEGALILPKLFRRATDYLKAVNKPGFSGDLAEWIASTVTQTRNEDDRVVLADQTEVSLSDLIIQRNATVVFQPDLLDITFVEK